MWLCLNPRIYSSLYLFLREQFWLGPPPSLPWLYDAMYFHSVVPILQSFVAMLLYLLYTSNQGTSYSTCCRHPVMATTQSLLPSSSRGLLAVSYPSLAITFIDDLVPLYLDTLYGTCYYISSVFYVNSADDGTRLSCLRCPASLHWTRIFATFSLSSPHTMSLNKPSDVENF